jgi:hypothetical protein
MNLFRKLSSLAFPKSESREDVAPPNAVVTEPPTGAQEPVVVVNVPEPVVDDFRSSPNHSSR